MFGDNFFYQRFILILRIKDTVGDLTGYSGGLGYNLVLLNLIYPMRTPKENHNKVFSRKALLTEQK
jgi:hypothetical protein